MSSKEKETRECMCPCEPGKIHNTQCACRLGCVCYDFEVEDTNPGIPTETTTNFENTGRLPELYPSMEEYLRSMKGK